MKKNAIHKKKKKSPRIPMDGVLKLREGGVHSSKKGAKGYNRAKEKGALREENLNNSEG